MVNIVDHKIELSFLLETLGIILWVYNHNISIGLRIVCIDFQFGGIQVRGREIDVKKNNKNPSNI